MPKTILDGDLVNPVSNRHIVGTAIDDGVNQMQVTGSTKLNGTLNTTASTDGGIATFRRTGGVYNAGVFLGASEASGTAWLDYSGSAVPLKGSLRLGGVEVMFLATSGITVVGTVQLGVFTVALLPAGANGKISYASNGRKVGEAVAAGTGIPVYYANGAWRRYSDDSAVAV